MDNRILVSREERRSGRNPLGLHLGQRVRYSHVAEVNYFGPGEEKTVKFTEFAGQGFITGVCFKCEGERIPAYRENGMFDSYMYTIPATFKVTRRHLFYEVKLGLNYKTRLIAPEHLCTFETYEKKQTPLNVGSSSE